MPHAAYALNDGGGSPPACGTNAGNSPENWNSVDEVVNIEIAANRAAHLNSVSTVRYQVPG